MKKYNYIIFGLLIFSLPILAQQPVIDAEGGIKISNTSDSTEGVIQYDGIDFLGRVLGQWKSLTKPPSIWQQDSTNRIYYSLGNVGIGTISPTHKLEVNSTALINNPNSRGSASLKIARGSEARDAATVSFGELGNYGWYFGLLYNAGSASPDLHISQDYKIRNSNGSQAHIPELTILRSGNIGIGISAPRSKLHIANNTSETETANQLRLYDGSGDNSVYGLGISNSDFDFFAHRNFRFHTNSTHVDRGDEYFTILNNGRVGVGETNPADKLHIKLGNGSVRVFNNSKYDGIKIISDTLHDSRSQLRFYHGNFQYATIYTPFNANTQNASLQLRTLTPSSNINFAPNSVNRMTIQAASGYIGIGTTSPDANLHIHTGILQPGDVALRVGGKGDVAIDASGVIGGRMMIKEDGKVGINTPNPATPLHTKGLVRASFLTNLTEFVEIGHGGSNGFINTEGDGNLQFRHDGVALMNLKPDGKLFIGNVATPGDYKLYVEKGILTEEVKVAIKGTSDWADDAFDRLPSLGQVEKSINEKSHLHDMPSAQEIVNKGYSVTAMDAKLLQQIEWSWMHILNMNKQMKDVRNENGNLKAQLSQQEIINENLQRQIDELKKMINKITGHDK